MASEAGGTVAPCFEPSNLRRTIQIALVLGSILTLINQLDVLISGEVSSLMPLKIALNFSHAIHRVEPRLNSGHANGAVERLRVKTSVPSGAATAERRCRERS